MFCHRKSFLILKNLFQKSFSTTIVPSVKESVKYCDVAVVGGGIIGTSVARKIKQIHNNLKVTLIEKECVIGKHQSSHNSGVVHSGVFYEPNSLKAKFCIEGANLLKSYCAKKELPILKVGKMVLALNTDQVKDLKIFYKRGQQNGIRDICFLPSLCDIKRICANCEGLQALWIPNVYVVNFKIITESLADDFKTAGGHILYNFKVNQVKPNEMCEHPILLKSSDNEIVNTKYLILCGGLQSEYLTKLVYGNSNQKFMTLRAKYFTLDVQHVNGLNTNIYKVPYLNLPFLGAHVTPNLDNKILLGPWVVPSLTIDSYQCSDMNFGYVKSLVENAGFQKMILKHIRECALQAAKDLFLDLRVKEIQEIVPNLAYQHLEKTSVALQTQLLDSDGSFVKDFVFDIFEGVGIQSRTINLKFTPSPAATCCLSIANFIQDKFCKKTNNKI